VASRAEREKSEILSGEGPKNLEEMRVMRRDKKSEWIGGNAIQIFAMQIIGLEPE
jgi:hypothetical protein